MRNIIFEGEYIGKGCEDMQKRIICICTVVLLVFSIFGCAQTAEDTLTEEMETEETENTEIESEEEADIEGTDIEDVETAITEVALIAESDVYAEQWLDGNGYVSGITVWSVMQEDIDRIADMENLDSLTLMVSGDNIDLSPLGRLPHLRELTIFFAGGTDDLDLSFIKELRYLTEIYFDKCTSLENLSLFEDMRCLKDLHVGYVDDVDLNCLSGCVNLESINICGGHIRNVKGMSDLMSLHSLGLFELAPGEEPIMNDLEQISNLKGLESIQLRFVNVSDAGLLSDLPNLRHIFLVGTGISDIESLNNLERIESLEIFGNESERVKEQAEIYFKDVEKITVTEDIPNNLRNYQ